jgi:retron-type reverse transcriptase
VFSLICSFNNLFKAWNKIKSTSSNVKYIGDYKKSTFDQVDRNWFVSFRKKLFNGSYKYKPSRKVFIFKYNKSSKRFLTIGSFQDKVIQQALLQVLQQIYEGVFVWVRDCIFDSFLIVAI